MFVNNFITRFGRVHITRNKKGLKWRYTFHFPNGTAFHSDKRKYTIGQLKKIYLKEVPLDPQFHESRSN